MKIKSNYLQWIIILMVPFFLATYTFIIELIIMPEYAIMHWNYWYWYIVEYTLTRLIFFMPAVWIYPLIFKKRSRRSKFLGLVYAIGFAMFYSLVIFSNDPRMNVQMADKIMMSITYTLTALSIYYIYEFLGDNRKKTPNPQ
jgi:hypothetical protein